MLDMTKPDIGGKMALINGLTHKCHILDGFISSYISTGGLILGWHSQPMEADGQIVLIPGGRDLLDSIRR
jgi:hypothetical protein